MSHKETRSPELQFNAGEMINPEFLQIRYTDVPGRFLAKYVFNKDGDIRRYLKGGVGVDGSSVRGFASIDESDLLLVPDGSTLRPLPMLDFNVATAIADIYRGFSKGRLPKDPRYVSQCVEENLSAEGLTCQIGPEVECFVFDEIAFNDGKATVLSAEQEGQGKYPIRRKQGYDAPPFQDSLVEFRFEVARMLEKYYSIEVTNLNHEVASSGQIEINFMHSTLTRAADNVQTYKDVVHNVAKSHSKIATFMPKPIFDAREPTKGDNGSGMHVSTSLWDKSKGANNIFYDPDDGYAELGQKGRYFVGGLLSHAQSLAALVAPTVNSYRRVAP